MRLPIISRYTGPHPAWNEPADPQRELRLVMDTAELEEQFGRIGQNAMPAEQTLQALETLMSGSTAQKMVASIDWNKFKPVYETKRNRPLIECIEVKEVPEQKSSPTFSEQK